MALSAEEIHSLYTSRKKLLAARFARMNQVASVYDGTLSLPLPAWAKSEIDQAAVPNLLEMGTDQTARRVSSVLPNLSWPSLHPGFEAPDQRADMRRQANYGWWERNNFRSQMEQRSRWLIGYASAPVIIRPDRNLIKGGGPRWDMVHPYDMFPGPRALGDFTPHNVIVRHKRTLGWLRDRFEIPMARLKLGPKPSPDDAWWVTPVEVFFASMSVPIEAIDPNLFRILRVGVDNPRFERAVANHPLTRTQPTAP